MSTLLLTATIDSGYFGNVETKVSDTDVRRSQYEEALGKYITRSNFDCFVFAENSGAHLDEARFHKLCEEYGKKIEFLTVLGDVEGTKKYGKSYGESRIIADALKCSRLLEAEDAFYKVTGRVWVENINDLMVNDHRSHFVTYNYKQWTITIFFYLTKSDYRDFIEGNEADYGKKEFDHLKMGGQWLPIEKTYYARLVASGKKIKAFRSYPDFRGNLGGTNLLYTKSKANLKIRNILNKMGFFNLSKYPNWLEGVMEKGFEIGYFLFTK